MRRRAGLRNRLRRRLRWTLTLLATAALPASAGTVAYPALGNMDLEEGTLEIWFTPMTELYPSLGKQTYLHGFSLFSMTVPDHFTMSGLWCSKLSKNKTQHLLVVSMHAPGDMLLPVPGQAPKGWKPGEKHHVAFRWKGREMDTYADGQRVGSRSQATGLSGKLAGINLLIGSANAGDNRVIIHAVRVSSIPRPPEALKQAQPAADLSTLLLDRFRLQAFESLQPSRGSPAHTRAQIISGLSGETGGEIRGKFHFIEKPMPGLALWPGP